MQHGGNGYQTTPNKGARMTGEQKMLALLKEIHQWALDTGILMHGTADTELFSRVSDLIDEIEQQ
jgi:hypothetical protein